MKLLTGECFELDLATIGGPGYALAIDINSAGDEGVPISGVFLSRKGINAFPEFAEGFGMDASTVVQGLEPEAYQIRVEMLVNHAGKVTYGDGKSEFRLSPTKKVRFIMPLPFQGIQYFLDAPEEDLFVAAVSLSEGEQIITLDNLQAIMQRSVQQHGQLGQPFNVNFVLQVPQNKLPDSGFAGTVNTWPIRPMPNT